jgi:hypothetical protein
VGTIGNDGDDDDIKTSNTKTNNKTDKNIIVSMRSKVSLGLKLMLSQSLSKQMKVTASVLNQD